MSEGTPKEKYEDVKQTIRSLPEKPKSGIFRGCGCFMVIIAIGLAIHMDKVIDLLIKIIEKW